MRCSPRSWRHARRGPGRQGDPRADPEEVVELLGFILRLEAVR